MTEINIIRMNLLIKIEMMIIQIIKIIINIIEMILQIIIEIMIIQKLKVINIIKMNHPIIEIIDIKMILPIIEIIIIIEMIL